MKKLDHREEKALSLYFRGMPQKTAMIEAGYSPSMANKSSVLFNRDYMQDALEKKRARSMTQMQLSEDWIVERLMTIAGANPGEMIEIDEEGNRRVNWSKFTKQMQALVQDFEEETYMEGRGPGAKEVKRIKIRNSDRLRAIDMLCKIMGLYQDTSVNINIEQDLIDRLNAADERVKEKYKPNYVED